jgi:protein translocase subunit secA
MGFADILTSLFGNKSQRDLKEINPYVDRIKAVYPSIERLSHDELRAKTMEIRQKVQEYVAAEKNKIAELKANIESLDIDQREDVWVEVDKLGKKK